MSDIGDRFNTDKPRFDLLPWDVLGALAWHYHCGAQKYDARNWEQGLKWNEGCAASLARHLAKWSTGEDFETENIKGKDYTFYHDVAILWNAAAMVAMRLRGRHDLDDRPKKITKE